MHLLLISPCDSLTLNVSIINASFAAVFLMQSFHADNFSGCQYSVSFILLPLECSINFSLNLLGTGFLYLLVIMMNSSFMPVHHFVCHLDLN